MDEQYFLTVLASVGTTNALQRKVDRGGSVDRALSLSRGLDERITRSLAPGRDGRVYLAPDLSRISRVLQKIAFGLFVTKYRRVPAMDAIRPVGAFPYNIHESRPTGLFAAAFSERFRPKRWTDVQPGVFAWIVVREPTQGGLCCIMDFHATLWGAAFLPHPTGVRRAGGSELQALLPLHGAAPRGDAR
ncbi:MAG: hypothetical protein HY713_13860 [candidate division NC10 bacterium]|nr:hypothetical protein [candidate division NC10 bacterium]